MVDSISICQQYSSHELWRDTSSLVDVLSGNIVGKVGAFYGIISLIVLIGGDISSLDTYPEVSQWCRIVKIFIDINCRKVQDL